MNDQDLQDKGVAAQGARTKVSQPLVHERAVLITVLESIPQCQDSFGYASSSWTGRVCGFQG